MGMALVSLGHWWHVATGESPLTLTGEEKAANVQWAQVSKVVKTRNRIACHMKWEYLQVSYIHRVANRRE